MSLRAVHVAEASGADLAGSMVVERVGTSGEALDRLETRDGIDCVVCAYALDGETGLDVLRAVRERDETVPFLLYTDRTDGDVAIEATRLGVTEYASLQRLRNDGTTLAERVHEMAGKRAGTAVPYDRNAIAELTRIAASDDAAFDAKVEELLDLGRRFLDLDIGFVSRIEGDDHTITHARGSDELAEHGTVDLSMTYCHHTVETDGLFGIRDAETEGWSGTPEYEESGLSCYLGGKITVDDELYGTLCFADEDPRALAFSDAERTFIELLVEWLGHEITRSEREASLRRYKAIHETVQQMVFVIGEGVTIDLLTEPLAERFGYDREELRGASATEFLGAEAIEAGYAAFDDLQEAPPGASKSIEATLSTADGRSVPVEIELSLLSETTEFRGLVGVVHDRSDLAATEAELAEQRERFRYLFEHIPDPVAEVELTDDGGRIRAVNPTFESQFGYDESTAVGQSLRDLIVPEDNHERSRELGAEIRRSGSASAEVRRNTTDGYRRFLFRGFEYETDGTDRAFYIYTDITEQAEREQYLQVINRILRHNLRNDLSVISGFAGVLADELDDETLSNHADVIESTANGLVRLAERANEMARIVGQRTEDPDHGVDLVALVDEVLARVSDTHPEAELVSDLPESCPVRADSDLSRALAELARNGIEYSDADTPRVAFELRTEQPEYVTLAVRDNGPGIPAADRERVLGEREITQLDHAQGIGLWLVKWVVESYGGDLGFEVTDEGTTVLVELPKHEEGEASIDAGDGTDHAT